MLFAPAYASLFFMKSSITRDRLDELLEFNPGSAIWTWRITRGGTARKGSRAGSINAIGYEVLRLDQRDYLAHRVVWFWHNGTWPDGLIDHIDLDRLNNRVFNLRIATAAQNHWNRPPNKRNKSGYKGVIFHKVSGRWAARISASRMKFHIGLFDTAEAAHEAYVAYSKLLHGEFSRP